MTHWFQEAFELDKLLAEYATSSPFQPGCSIETRNPGTGR
jgi:hypothetical protein